jgi:hypothetical protein
MRAVEGALPLCDTPSIRSGSKFQAKVKDMI